MSVVAAVNLTSFTYQIGNGFILIQWETATEVNHAGFYVTRSLQVTGTYSRISNFYPARGDVVSGDNYEYVDDNVILSTVYFYKLEIVDIFGDSDFTDALEVNYGAPTSTLSLTRTMTQTTTATIGGVNTQTPTFSPTMTLNNNTSTPTRTRTATIPVLITNTTQPQNTPVQPTSARPTSLITPTKTRTATFIPLPTFTLLFPTRNVSRTPTFTPVRIPTLTQDSIKVSDEPPPAFGQSILLAGIIVLVWILIGAGVYYLIRRATA
jgi:hypothetical protein